MTEVSDSWAVLETHGFPPEAVGWPARNIAGLLPEAIEAAISTLIRQREDLLAEVLQLRSPIQPQRMPDSLREVLKQHWLTAIHCDHKDGTDRPGCYCATWYCEPQPNVGAAVDKWIDHVIEQLSLTRPDGKSP